MYSRRLVRMVAMVLAILVLFAGCEFLTGPEGSQGSPGKDGNANVDLYIFDGHNFNANSFLRLHVDDVSEIEMKESAWLIYLVINYIFYQMPGPGWNAFSTYRSFVFWSNALQLVVLDIIRADGNGEGYDEIRVIRIAASDVKARGTSPAPAQSLIPDHLDTSDYHAVVEYYGLDR